MTLPTPALPIPTLPIPDLLVLLVRQTREHAVLLLDPDGRIVGWQGAAERLFHYTEAEVLGHPLALLFTEEDQRRGQPALELSIAAVGGRSEDERWHRRKDGSVFWASGVVTPLIADEGRLVGYAKLLRDRTDARAYVLSLQNRLDAHRRGAQERRVELARLLHELRNPLAPLRTTTHLLGRTCTGPDTAKLVAVLDRQLLVLERLLKDMQALADAGGTVQPPAAIAPLDLRDVIDTVVTACRGEAEARGQRMEVLMPPGPVMVQGDVQRLDQAIMNLVNNASKYTPEGGRIWVKCQTEGGYALVRVEDTGVGIASDLLPRIFEMFVREEQAGPAAPPGEGIGLSVVQRIALEHRGVVEVRSDGKGKGSEFTLRLPLLPPAPRAERAGEARPTPA